MIKRNKCVVCQDKKFKHLNKFRNMPISMSTTVQHRKFDKYATQEFVICKTCGCIQLKFLIDAKILYNADDYHKPGTVGKLWSTHHEQFAKLIAKYTKNTILEIGAGSTTLATLTKKYKNYKNYIIIDPTINKTLDQEILILNEFFDESKINNLEFDTVVLSHTVEHFYDVNKTLKELSEKMKVGDKLIISIPIIANMLKDKLLHILSFEHTYLTTEKNTKYVLLKNNFKLIESIQFNKYNNFLVAEKTNESLDIVLTNEYKNNISLWKSYITNLKLKINNINKFLSKNTEPVFLFGAHITTQILLNRGMLNKYVAILDNDKNKHNKRLYGTNMFVYSPEILDYTPNAIVIINADQYSAEIKNQIKQKVKTLDI